MFSEIHIKEWRQFSDVNIVFHDHLTVLTGANGAGKTTILNLLSKCVGWEPQFVSSYEQDDKGLSKYVNSIIDRAKSLINVFANGKSGKTVEMDKLGNIIFSDGISVDLVLPDNVSGGTYGIKLNGETTVKGVYVTSHRPNFPYKAVKAIPTTVATRKQIYKKYDDFNKTYVFDTYRDPEKISATSLIKETLASLAIFGYGNPSVTPNESARALFEGYIDILKIVLPPEIGFESISVVVPEVMLCTKSGNFPIDAVSGGISSIIDITWQLYMFADPSESFVALIDEPENHLHPELQKNFLGNLIKAFPNVQFIIATHNPFMITAQKDSNVYVLDYNDDYKVFSCQLDYVNRAGTSNTVLRDVLGISSTMPLWAEETLDAIVEKYSKLNFTNETLSQLRAELSTIGLADYIPESIARVAVEGNPDAKN